MCVFTSISLVSYLPGGVCQKLALTPNWLTEAEFPLGFFSWCSTGAVHRPCPVSKWTGNPKGNEEVLISREGFSISSESFPGVKNKQAEVKMCLQLTNGSRHPVLSYQTCLVVYSCRAITVVGLFLHTSLLAACFEGETTHITAISLVLHRQSSLSIHP